MSRVKYQLNVDGAPFEEVWERVTRKTDIKTLTELANIVGKKQQTISTAKQKGIFPYGWAYLVARKYNLFTEWLVTGNGPVKLDDTFERKDIFNPTLKEADQWLFQLTKDDSRRREWFAIAFEEAFPMFRKWKKRKEKEEGTDNTDPQSNVA